MISNKSRCQRISAMAFGPFKIISIILIFSLCTLTAENILGEEDEPKNLSKSDYRAYRGQIFAIQGDVHVVWTDKSRENTEIFYVSSTDGGKTFRESLNLSNNEGVSAWPRFVVNGVNVFVTWYDYSPGQSDVFFAKSSDKGTSFDSINLSSNINASYNPWIGTSEDYVYVVWNDGGKSQELQLGNETRIIDVITGEMEIICARSEDRGETFELFNLSNSTSLSWNPRMVISGENVYITWNEYESNSDIFFLKSSDYGSNFAKPINLSNSNEVSVDSAIQVAGNLVYVLWQTNTTNNSDVFFVKSDNGGISFEEPRNLSNTSGDTRIVRDASFVAKDQSLYLVWYDNTLGNYDVFFSYTNDGGVSFSNPINLSNNERNAVFPQIALMDKNVYVIWQDSSLRNNEIFLRQSIDGGKSFGSIKNLSNDRPGSILSELGPQIFVEQNRVYTIWENGKTNGTDMFFKTFNAITVSKAVFELQTLDGSMNIDVNFNVEGLEPEKMEEFEISFSDPETNNLIDNVNYSFIIEDIDGNKIIEKLDQSAKKGIGIQNVVFPNTGTFSIEITVNSAAGETLESKYSSASAVMTVIPEFPFAVILIGGLAMSSVLIILRFFQRSP